MKATSIILPVFIILLVLVLLVATDVIRIAYCNPSLGIPCKSSPGSVPQTTLPAEPQEKTTQPEEKPATGDGNVPGQCPAIEDIKKEIEDSNYCAADKDCLVTFFGCPFGCGGYVNAKIDIPALKARIAQYKECMNVNCTNKCIPVPEPTCVDNKCIGKY